MSDASIREQQQKKKKKRCGSSPQQQEVFSNFDRKELPENVTKEEKLQIPLCPVLRRVTDFLLASSKTHQHFHGKFALELPTLMGFFLGGGGGGKTRLLSSLHIGDILATQQQHQKKKERKKENDFLLHAE